MLGKCRGSDLFPGMFTHLGASPTFLPLATGIPGLPGTTGFTDSNAPGLGPCFYRVGIQP